MDTAAYEQELELCFHDIFRSDRESYDDEVALLRVINSKDELEVRKAA